MNWRGTVGTRAETCGYFTPDLAIATGPIVEAPFKHSQDYVIVAYYEPLHLSSLAFGQPGANGLPLVTHASGQAGQDGVDASVQTRINVEYEFTEIRQASRSRNSSSANEKCFSTCVS